MDKKETVKKNTQVPSRRQIATLGILGFVLVFCGVGTDDAREVATQEKRAHMASPAATTTMEILGLASLLGSSALLRKRQNQR